MAYDRPGRGQSGLASVLADHVCRLINRGRFKLFCLVASMEEMTIKCRKVWCGLEPSLEGGASIIFSGENGRIFVGGGGG